ncbi:hemerythrin HHE cation binding domain-containing protein [Hyaloraphidium curvatum]|nr:hemerythrin HHE cation binding domain-containing protein [Hyaloraphidium curvatum]
MEAGAIKALRYSACQPRQVSEVAPASYFAIASTLSPRRPFLRIQNLVSSEPFNLAQPQATPPSTHKQDMGAADVFEDHAWALKHGIHEVLRNTLGQTIKHADPSPADLSDYLSFTDSFLQLLHQHHDHEEEIEFPAFEGRGPFRFEPFQKDHEKLLQLMGDIEKHIAAARTDPSAYSPQAFRELLTSLQALVVPHLQAEEEMSTTENLRAYCKAEEIVEVEDKIMKHAMSTDGTIFPPLILSNLKPGDRKRFFYQHAGWMFEHVIFPWILYPKHKQWWRKFSKYPL